MPALFDEKMTAVYVRPIRGPVELSHNILVARQEHVIFTLAPNIPEV